MFKSILLTINGIDSATQVATQAVETGTKNETMKLWEMALNGGWIMWVLLALLVLCIYIFIERFLTLKRALKSDSTQFMGNIRSYIHQGDIDGARSLAKSTNSPIARMVDSGLSRLGRPLGDNKPQ